MEQVTIYKKETLIKMLKDLGYKAKREDNILSLALKIEKLQIEGDIDEILADTISYHYGSSDWIYEGNVKVEKI